MRETNSKHLLVRPSYTRKCFEVASCAKRATAAMAARDEHGGDGGGRMRGRLVNFSWFNHKKFFVICGASCNIRADFTLHFFAEL